MKAYGFSGCGSMVWHATAVFAITSPQWCIAKLQVISSDFDIGPSFWDDINWRQEQQEVPPPLTHARTHARTHALPGRICWQVAIWI